MRVFCLPLFFLLTLLASGALGADESESESEVESAAWTRTAELHYAVSWLEIPFAEASARLRWREGEFSARGESWSAGPFAALFAFRGFAETRGEWDANGPVPREHRNGGEWRGKKRTVRVWWEQDGVAPEWEAHPPPDLEKVSAVAREEMRGALDPFTAALAAGAQVGLMGVCGSAEKIWDGRRLARWTLSHAGEEELTADAPGAWGGRAAVCELRIEKMGGFWRNARHSPQAPTRVWVAEVLPGLWAPARAEVYSRWGKVVARLDVRKTRGDAPPSAAEVAGH